MAEYEKSVFETNDTTGQVCNAAEKCVKTKRKPCADGLPTLASLHHLDIVFRLDMCLDG
jgi:hypothetical protein